MAAMLYLLAGEAGVESFDVMLNFATKVLRLVSLFSRMFSMKSYRMGTTEWAGLCSMGRYMTYFLLES